MKIELKKIEFSERMSEETNCFAANLYINGIHAGITGNRGTGGATTYTAIDPKGKVLIEEAENYCKDLPAQKWESQGRVHELPMDLESFIDNFLENYLQNRSLSQFRNKIEKASLNCIVFGVPDQSFQTFAFKSTIAEIISFPNGLQLLADSIRTRVKPLIAEGQLILNTNIPETVFLLAKLGKHQYLKSNEAVTMQVKKRVKKH